MVLSRTQIDQLQPSDSYPPMCTNNECRIALVVITYPTGLDTGDEVSTKVTRLCTGFTARC